MEDRSRIEEKIANELFPIDGETATEDQCLTRILYWKVWAFLPMDVTGGLDAYEWWTAKAPGTVYRECRFFTKFLVQKRDIALRLIVKSEKLVRL